MKRAASATSQKDLSWKHFLLKTTPTFVLIEAIFVGSFFFFSFLGSVLVPPVQIPTNIADPNPNAPVTCGGQVMTQYDVCDTYYGNSTVPLDKVPYDQVKIYQSQDRINKLRQQYETQAEDQKNNPLLWSTGCIGLLGAGVAFLSILWYISEFARVLRSKRRSEKKAAQA